MTDYSYDVFFSYKRDPQSNDWHAIVREKMAFWIRKELGRTNLDVFFDRESIETGDRWKEKIEAGLRGSRCLVCMWSPDYFRSRWCMSEWRSFVDREQSLEMEMGGLIVPASIHDGESFPNPAKDYHHEDFNNYFATMPYFWQTADAWTFEKEKLKAFARKVAKRIEAAPEYRHDFPVVIVPESEVAARGVIGRVSDQAA